MKVEVTERAEAEIRQAYAYLQQHSPTAADRWLRRLRDQILSLSKMPRRCAMSPEAQHLGLELRHLILGRRSSAYRVIFLVKDVTGSTPWVQVVSVRHAARDAIEPSRL